MGCNCNKTTHLSMGCCQPVLGPIENYYTKYQIDQMLSGATSGCCITPEEVDEKISAATDDMATEQWVGEQGYITGVDLSDYATLEDLTDYALKSEIPSLSGYATEQWVLDKHYISGVDLSDYVTFEDMPDLTSYATKQWVINQNYALNSEVIQYITSLQQQINSLTQAISGCCGETGETEYRWITMTGENDYCCSGTTKMTKEKEQSSADGIVWVDTGNYRTGSTILEENSTDCGYSPTPCEKYLTIIANGSGTISLTSRKHPQSYQYSKDSGNTWTTVLLRDEVPTTYIDMISGDTIMFKGELEISQTYIDVGVANFHSTIPSYEVEGNPMSLIYGDNFRGQTNLSGKTSVFDEMFRGCSGLTSAENLCLPATTLSTGCYEGMFMDCTSLTGTPELPATTLANHCYGNMFAGCTSLTTAPELPATTLANNCYGGMFMESTSLTAAPVLSASTLVQGCYSQMFQGCTSLNYIKCLATDISASHCTGNWVADVAANGTFTKASGMADWTSGINGIPTGWIVQ